MRRQLLCLALFAMGLVISHPVYAASDFIRLNSKISYDPSNYLVFEDVGRTERLSDAGDLASIRFGDHIRLHVHKGDSVFDVDIVSPEKNGVTDPRYDMTKSSVKQIVYRDPDSVWIIDRAGHRGDYSTLYSLKERKIIAFYSGESFSVSPDKTMVAYGVDLYHGRQLGVFVNGTLVYPIIADPGKSGLDGWNFAVGDETMKTLIPDTGDPTSLTSNLDWDDNTLRFQVAVSGGNGADSKSIVKEDCSVKHLMTKGSGLDVDASNLSLNSELHEAH